jgi:DNA-binding transcriptional regulator PaaX
MQLEDLPTKISQRILRSVTWTGVDAELPGHIWRRHLIVQLSRIGGRVSNLRAAVIRLFH